MRRSATFRICTQKTSHPHSPHVFAKPLTATNGIDRYNFKDTNNPASAQSKSGVVFIPPRNNIKPRSCNAPLSKGGGHVSGGGIQYPTILIGFRGLSRRRPLWFDVVHGRVRIFSENEHRAAGASRPPYIIETYISTARGITRPYGWYQCRARACSRRWICADFAGDS